MAYSTALIQSLQNPELYPHSVEYFKVIETHISWVLLTGHYAYKIKKPLNLGFLDFSSLQKRRFFCHEELRLNSRLAPGIYLDVVAISGTEQQPQLTDSDTVIEYAVKMHQFQTDHTFDQLLAADQLTSKQLIQTAHLISIFHSQIKSATSQSEYGSATAVMQPVLENFKQIEQRHSLEKSATLKHLHSWSEQQHKALTPLFTARKKSGFIRECHGDLHLRNIAEIADKVVPFDGIDFNPALYWIDVISEIAFLVMDLQDKQRDDLAYQFINQYLQDSGDYAGLKCLRFYLVYRAIVMAKVSAIRAKQHSSTEDHQQDINRYKAYLKLASSYTQPCTPLMILMHGVSGSGKSWLSEQMISRYPVIRIRSDVERKRLHCSADTELYSQTMTEQTYQHLLQLAADILSADFTVVVDATFLQQQQRQQFIQLAEQTQTPFLIIHTDTDKQHLLQRLKQRVQEQTNVSDADQTIMEHQLLQRQALTADELQYSIRIDTAKPIDLTNLWKRLDEHLQSK